MRNINYYTPTDIRFGWGRASEVGEIVAEFGKRCLMVTVKPPSALDPLFERIKKLCAAAGLVTGLLTNMPLEKIPYFANAVSALKITKKGAMNVPTRQEVEDFMNA